VAEDASNQNDPLIYQGQVSDEFKIPRGTLRHWRAHNQGPPSFTLSGNNKGGGRVVYRRSEVLAWLESVERKTRRGDGVDITSAADGKPVKSAGKRSDGKPVKPAGQRVQRRCD
jgi:hypothetical protein